MKIKKINTELGLDDSVGLWNSNSDRWSRRAKHQLSHADLENAKSIFENNESVLYEGEEVTVKIPDGPNNTSGIIVEGKLKMVDKTKLSKLDEGVMGGLKGVDSINRMMQLAGLDSGTRSLKAGVVESLDMDDDEKIVDTAFDKLVKICKDNGESHDQAVLSALFDFISKVVEESKTAEESGNNAQFREINRCAERCKDAFLKDEE